MSENQVVKAPKGRFHWVIPELEIIIAAIYLYLVLSEWKDFSSSLDLKGMLESATALVWFLVVATAIVTVLCFMAPFKSKANKRIAIWNIIWIALTVYSLIS